MDGRGRIRTCEGISHQIYSLTRLSTSVHARVLVFESRQYRRRGGDFNRDEGALIDQGCVTVYAAIALGPLPNQ